jgi:predicted NAD/FAD-dependent oxidoreductase
MEKFGNGYKGRAATRRRMRGTFRGFADHSPRSLKPVHGRVGGLVLASVWRVLYQETGEIEKKETAT